MSPTKIMARRTLKSYKSRWNQKVGYSWPYMERKGKPSALMGWIKNNRLERKLENKTS